MTPTEIKLLTALAERVATLRRLRRNPKRPATAVTFHANGVAALLQRSCDEITKRAQRREAS